MANNRLYLVIHDDTMEEAREMLLAKGWTSGWEVYDPDTLVERLENLLKDLDIGATCGGNGGATKVFVEDEEHRRPTPEWVEKWKHR